MNFLNLALPVELLTIFSSGILESKGIHRDNANGSLVGNTEALEHDQHGHKDKTSLKQKIKDKLHKH